MTFLHNLLHDINLNFFLILTAVITAFVLTCLAIALANLNKIKTKHQSNPDFTPKKSSAVVTSQDIKAIAGDDVMSTQLDLARAYIEMDKKNLAKKILTHVIKNGDTVQQSQAQQLITALES